MKLTLACSYALHAVVHLASQDTGKPVTAEQIARSEGIPEKFLTKVLKPLVHARMVQTIMGPGGGYRLAKPAGQISLLEIMEAVDGPIDGRLPIMHADPSKPANSKIEAACTEAADKLRNHLQAVRINKLVGKS